MTTTPPDEPPAARAPRRRRDRHLLVGAGAALVVLGGSAAVLAMRAVPQDSGRVPDGVSVGGVPVGGLTRAEAERAVERLARPARRQIVVTGPGGLRLTVPVAQLGPTPDARRAVALALDQGSVWQRIRREAGLGGERRVPVAFRLDPAAVRSVVARVAGEVGRPARSARVVVGIDEVRVVPAVAGRGVDADLLAARLARIPATARTPVVAVAPGISTADARTTALRARRILSHPVVVRGARGRASVPPGVVAGGLAAREEDGRLRLTIDPGTLRPALARAFGGQERTARSATFRVEGRRVRVVPGRSGRRVDAARVAAMVVADPGRRVFRAPFTVQRPARTTEQAQRMRIRELVSEFTTPYSCCQPRVTNIRRAAAILDGTVIPAGGTFSLNEALGERTRARGFVAAPQINAGRLEDAVGGGVSQVATTTFNAAFFAGLKLDQFTPHEFYISRYPPGREATVSWGGPELVVTNDWPAAVLMKVSAGDSGITVRLYSARLGRRVATTTSTPEGTSGAFPVSFTRKVFRDGRLLRDEDFRWTYKASPE
ncbi:MAG: VanW family protein [Thermoleophilia bacterium]|jgi:vancomycin resistance protein YoaR|nr:VanW family protein [Thermoleophilia bacterium]